MIPAAVEQARRAYVRGDLSIEQFEKRIEVPLLLESGRATVPPPGWQPIPPCNHQWIEITRLGQSGHEFLCAHCSEERWEPS